MKKKAGLLLSLTLAASTVLGACGNSDKASSDKKDTKDNKDFKVGLVTDVGALMISHLTNLLGKGYKSLVKIMV